MPKRSSKDENQLAKGLIDEIIAETESQDTTELARPEKNPAAVALGRLGGLKGGKARASSLTSKRRSEIAKKAADSRWSKKNQDKG
ncbi:MAG TPA: hypothetical protein VK612_11660 [Pyrinomonadaceae bacterium]|nr:hypothetical protein [Pyrinomonadaceae bacterium]